MNSDSEKGPTEQEPSTLNFIYACTLCGASFAEVYEGHHETVRGLSDGINPKERLVTRLFLGKCTHVFCGGHLEGGAPPFHLAGQRPKAPCPVCIKEQGDSEPRELYSVRGFNKDEYDPQIPSSWFNAPPIRLDGNGKEMEALRFQYIALIRYCQNTYATRKPLQTALADAKTKLASMQDLASEEHAKVLNLQQENERLRAGKDQFEAIRTEMQRLQGIEQELEHFRRLNVNPRDFETFTANKAAIRHYLKLVPKLLDQNEQMQKRLANLGFAMALEPVGNFKGIDPHAFDSDEALPGGLQGDTGAMLRKTASSHTAGRSAHTSGRAGAESSSPFIQRPIKRQRLDSPLPGNMHMDHPPSRDAMPPPPKPMSRVHSMRKIFPNIRKKFSNGRSTRVKEDVSESGDVQMYDDGHWQDTDQRQSITHDRFGSEAPYMSGALPVEQPTHESKSRGSQLLSSVGVDENNSNFTFRASSPVKRDRKMNNRQPDQLPTEPSYIRLMDGLSSDTSVELGLKDPRDSMDQNYRNDNRSWQVTNSYEDQYVPREGESQKRWGLEHPFMHQSPYGSSACVDVHQNPSNSRQANENSNRVYNQPTFIQTTPVPRRQQQSNHQIESVVSPFFRSNHNQAPAYSRPRPGPAKPQDSSNRSGGYLSQRSRMSNPQATSHEPRSLNGLSFFDSPVNSRNEPIQYSHGRRAPEPVTSSRYQQSHHLDSRGFITRPEEGHSPYVRDSVYGSSQNRPPYSSQAPRYTQAAIPLPTFSRFSNSRLGQVPSSMPSIIPARSPVRTQTQWESLQRVGVRSSRNADSGIAGNTFTNAPRNVFPSAGRRNVRR